jgi:hypothetical protein
MTVQKMTEQPEKTDDGFAIVYSKEDLPTFDNERQEHDFWSTHVWSEELMDEAAPRNFPAPLIRERSASTSLRLDEDTVKRLKQLARKKGKSYQTLLKEFVSERLYEEEKREGVLG